MEREDELLAMLAEMEGEWCSRRKKRRIVRACLLGDALPVGWKLIIALRRKGGRFFPYCRRYISPTGEHLASCKEVTSYLKSYFGINDTSVLRDIRDEEHQHQQIVDVDQDFPDSTTISNACVPIEPDEKEDSVLGIDNLPDVKVSDLYECHSCNVSFGVKDEYMKHLMSLHRKTTKKYRLGSSVGAGVIIRDGKFECQFCHKVFEERRRYLGHVGNHVRGAARRSEVSPVQVLRNASPPCKDQLPTNNGISRMAALIEIAQSSIQEISPSNVSNVDEVSLAEDSRAIDGGFKTRRSLSFCLNKNSSKEGMDSREELSLPEKPTETCVTCPNETEMEQNTREDNALSEELNPTYDMVTEISMTNEDMVNDPSACLDELEMGKDDCKYRCLSKELNPCSKMGKISMINGKTTCSKASPNELGMEKDYREGKRVLEEVNPHDKGSDRESKEQLLTSNTTIIPVTKTDLHAENTNRNCEWEYTAAQNSTSSDEPKEMLGIHYLFCNEKSPAVDGTGDMIDSNCVAECATEHAQEYDVKELASVSAESHASGYTVPQTSFNASSQLDEMLGKERQNMCGLDQNLESMMRPEYMKLDEVETQMYDVMTGEDLVSLSAISMGFENNNTDMGMELDPPVGFHSQPEFRMEMSQRSVTTTLCVWCGGEFCHEIVDIELQPDSVGFMCPTCRNKISKQFNDLECNFSLNSHYY